MAVNIRKREQAEIVDCSASNVVGDVVRITADDVGGVYQGGSLDIDNALPHRALGVIIQKLTTTRCVVQTDGEMIGIYSGLTPGKPLFVDTSSRLNHAVPPRPASGVRSVYPAALALSADVVLLRFQTPMLMRPA